MLSYSQFIFASCAKELKSKQFQSELYERKKEGGASSLKEFYKNTFLFLIPGVAALLAAKESILDSSMAFSIAPFLKELDDALEVGIFAEELGEFNSAFMERISYENKSVLFRNFNFF